MERQQAAAGRGRALREHRDRLPAAQGVRDLVDDAQRIALALALDDRACRRRRPGAEQRPVPDVGLGDEAGLGHRPHATAMMSSHDTWLATQQHRRLRPMRLRRPAGCPSRAASVATTMRMAHAGRRASRSGKRNEQMRQAVERHGRRCAARRTTARTRAHRQRSVRPQRAARVVAGLRTRPRRRPACSARGPAARSRRTACACPGS